MPKLLFKLVAGAPHMPVARNQAQRLEAVLVEPTMSLLGIRPGVDRFAAEIDATIDQLATPFSEPPCNIRLGYRRICSCHQQPFRLPLAKDFNGMLDPATAAGQNNRRVGCRRRSGFSEGERKEDEA